MRSRFHLSLVPIRCLCALAGALLFLPALSGCDGSGSSSAASRGPVVSTALPSGGQALTSAAATLPYSGTNVTLNVEISSATALNTTSNPPTINVFGPGGTSVINGPQPLTAVSGDANGYTYLFNIPPGTPVQTYTFVVYAQDTFGNKGNTPFIVGTQKF